MIADIFWVKVLKKPKTPKTIWWGTPSNVQISPCACVMSIGWNAKKEGPKRELEFKPNYGVIIYVNGILIFSLAGSDEWSATINNVVEIQEAIAGYIFWTKTSIIHR